MATTPYTVSALQRINISKKAVTGEEYIQDNGQGMGSLYIGQRDGTLLFVKDNIDLRAQIAVGEILENSANVSLTYNEEENIITSDLEETGVVAGTYGDATNTPQITVDENGRVTAVSLVPIDNDKVAVTSADTTPDFLGLKLTAGLNITLTVLNPGANESLKIDGAATPAAFISSVTDTPTIDLTVLAGNLSAAFVGDSDDVPEGVTNLYFLEARVLASLLAGLSVSGGTITAADNVLGAFGKLQNQINSLVGGVLYKGTWNATTNSPALASGVGTQGWYYVVSVAGSTNLDGITDWKLGDWAIFNGTTWEKVDNTDAVISVNGQTGIVVLTTTDIAEGINLYFTTARVLATALTGLSLATSQVISATDTILQAMGYLQAQTTAIRAGGFGTVMSGSGGVVATGSKGFITIPYGFVITDWYVTGNVSGSCVIDLKVSGASIIGAGNKPTLSGAQRANAAVSGWTTTSFAANTEIEYNLDSVTTLAEISLTIKATKAI